MLLTNPIDPEKQRTRALAKVYALLLRLAEENETADSDNLGRETLSAAVKQPTPEGVNHDQV